MSLDRRMTKQMTTGAPMPRQMCKFQACVSDLSLQRFRRILLSLPLRGSVSWP